jgi:DNA-binding protein Fis
MLINEVKINRDPSKLLNLLADDVQELIALIAEQQLMQLDSEEFKQAQLLSSQLNIARKTQDKTIFSVTGLQGAGKTTFVKRLYNLEDETLPIDAGRSESLPILITETEEITNSKESIFIVRRSSMDMTSEQCKFEIIDEIIQHKDFLEVARNPQPEDLWLEMKVPVRYFGAGISLALLPGFERNELNRSQRDLDFMLSMSTSVIFVVNYRMLAREDQRFKILEMINRYKEHTPLFALSFSDELNEEQKEYYAQMLLSKFGVPEDENGRITFTGKGETVDGWEGKIISSINHYGKLNQFSYKKQMETLEDLSAKALQLSEVINEQVRLKRFEEEDNQSNILQISEVINSFNTHKKELRHSIEQSLKQALEQHAKECSDNMDLYLINENKGIGKSVMKFFKGDQVTLKDKVVFREKTMDLWNDGDNQASEKVILDVLNQKFEAGSAELGFNQLSEQPQKIKGTTSNNRYAITESKINGSLSTFQPGFIDGNAALERINQYLVETSSDKPVQLKEGDLKVLPLLAVGFTQSLLAATPVLQSTNPELSTAKQVESLTNQIQKLQFDTSTLVKGTALFMGLDVMDGTFDTFGALTGILTKVGVSSAAAGPVAGLIIGGIAGGFAVHSGLQKIEQQRLDQSTYASKAFNMIALQQKESILATLDNVLSKMESRLIAVHQYRNRTGENYGKLDTTKYKISRIKEIAGTIQGMIYRNELYMG